MHSGTYFPSSKVADSFWSWLELLALESFQELAILFSGEYPVFNGADNFSGWLQALETQPFYSSAKEKDSNPRAAEI